MTERISNICIFYMIGKYPELMLLYYGQFERVDKHIHLGHSFRYFPNIQTILLFMLFIGIARFSLTKRMTNSIQPQVRRNLLQE